MTNEQQIRAMVSEFNKVFSSSTCPNLWMNLVAEESAEFVEAYETLMEAKTFDDKVAALEHTLKERADLIYVATGYSLAAEMSGEADPERIESMLELALKTTKSVMGLSEFLTEGQILRAVKLVHESNMTKLDSDGNPIFRIDGKILKGPNYKEPDMAKLVRDIMMEAMGSVYGLVA